MKLCVLFAESICSKNLLKSALYVDGKMTLFRRIIQIGQDAETLCP